MERRSKNKAIPPGRGERKEARDFILRHLYLVTTSEQDVLIARYGFIARARMPNWKEIEEMVRERVVLADRPGQIARHVHDCAIAKIVRHTTADSVPFLLAQPHADISALKQRARLAAQAAYRNGRIAKGPCAECENPESEMHHPNYDHPLRIVWLCKTCHALAHSRKHVTAMAQGSTW